MPIAALTIPTRVHLGVDPPIDINTLAAKVNEIATLRNVATVSIPTRSGGNGVRDLFRTDINTLRLKIDELAVDLGVSLSGLSDWALGYDITTEHTRMNALVIKTNQLVVAANYTAPSVPLNLGVTESTSGVIDLSQAMFTVPSAGSSQKYVNLSWTLLTLRTGAASSGKIELSWSALTITLPSTTPSVSPRVTLSHASLVLST